MMGNWGIIGYKGPGEETTASGANGGAVSGTTNFTYKDAASAYTNHTVALSSGGLAGWTAGNKQKLNDCPNADNWTVTVKTNGNTAGEAAFVAAIATANTATCTPLTPNFANIGK